MDGAGPAGAFLGVERSATGRVWRGPDADQDRRAMALMQAGGLPDAVARVLAARSVAPLDAARFLAPTLRDLLPDPASLRDMDRAVAALLRALMNGGRIAVFGDYDVDGAASAALLHRWLTAIGHPPTLYIPDRIDEGYGPNIPAMAALGAAHALILCVDCGTLSPDPIAAAADAGAEVVVLDHHLGGEVLPPRAAAVVNPNRRDEDGGLSHLCAAGVVFLFLVAANRALRARGAEVPDLLSLLDLVALATVADVAPLTGLNRAFVRQGLAVMGARGNPGLAALADVAGLGEAPRASHLGFALGPRINAGGRVGEADLGVRLLTEPAPEVARALAATLDRLNRTRQAIEGAVTEAALAMAEDAGSLVWAAGDGWHAGVIGIVAARLKEAEGRPALVFGFEGEAGKGSGRSVAGVDLGRAVARLAEEGLIERGGGHPMAAGLSLTRAQLAPAMARLATLLARGAGGDGPDALRIDGALGAGAVDLTLHRLIEAAGPFGAGAPAPRFALPRMRLRHLRAAGTAHLQLSAEDGSGARLDAIAFRAALGPLGAFLAARLGQVIHLAGRLERETWQGRARVKLHLDDAADPV